MYGTMVIGHSGSGKTTLVGALKALSARLGKQVQAVNLDPAADCRDYEVDIRDLIALEEVMEQFGLGPNGALVYCFQFLLKNVEWLRQRLKVGHYILIDMPGQIELYVGQQVVPLIIAELRLSLTLVELTDSALVTRVDDLLGLGLAALSSMCNIETPFLHVLSKVDLLQGARHTFNLRDYLEMDLLGMVGEDEGSTKRQRLRRALAQVFDSYSKVSFVPLSMTVPWTLQNVLYQADKANGYQLDCGDDPRYAEFVRSHHQNEVFGYQADIANLEEQLRGEEDWQKFQKAVAEQKQIK